MENIKNYGYLIIFIVLMIFAYEGAEKRIKDTFFKNEALETLTEKLEAKNIYNPQQTSIPITEIKKENPAIENKEMGRDPNLVGRWYQQKPGWKSGSLNTETYLYFFPDGTLKQTSQTHGSLDGNTLVYEPEEEPNIKALMEQGYRWYAQNGNLCLKDSNGNIATCHNYSFEGNYLFIRFAGSQRPTGYTRSN